MKAMRESSRYKETTAQKLVADPYAAEREWLPACSTLTSDAAVMRLSKIRAQGAMLLAVLASASIAYVVSTIVDVGYTWGYNFIEHFWSQATGANQGLMA